MIHQSFPISIQSPLSEQQQNQPPHKQQQKILNTNGINNSSKPYNHLPSTALPFSTEFPQPMCHFNVSPLFCPHYLWAFN